MQFTLQHVLEIMVTQVDIISQCVLRRRKNTDSPAVAEMLAISNRRVYLIIIVGIGTVIMIPCLQTSCAKQ